MTTTQIITSHYYGNAQMELITEMFERINFVEDQTQRFKYTGEHGEPLINRVFNGKVRDYKKIYGRIGDYIIGLNGNSVWMGKYISSGKPEREEMKKKAIIELDKKEALKEDIDIFFA